MLMAESKMTRNTAYVQKLVTHVDGRVASWMRRSLAGLKEASGRTGPRRAAGQRGCSEMEAAAEKRFGRRPGPSGPVSHRDPSRTTLRLPWRPGHSWT